MPTYSRKAFLPDVVPPLLADPAATEVIVVVDGSRDGSLEYLEALAASEPRLKPVFIENSGQTMAQQVALEQASGDVVLLIDDDVVSHERLVTGHAQRHAAEPNLVVLGYMPTLVPAERSPSRFTTVLYAEEYERASRLWVDDPASVLHGLWMGNLSLRREDCLRIGLFNPSYGSLAELYHVDRDFGLRCLAAGLHGVHDRSLRGDHILVRPLGSFLRNARAQGAGIVGLHQLHADVLGPISADRFSEGLPRPLRALVRATRRPRIYASASFVLRAWIRVAGRLRSTELQLPAAKLARRIEQHRGAIRALAGSPEPGHGSPPA